MPLEERAHQVLRQFERLPHAIAVVVVGDVLAPVHQRQDLAGPLAEVPRIDLLVASVDLDDRREGEDDAVANLLDERRLVDRHAVAELHQHFRAAGFRRMDRAGGVVDWLAGGDERAGVGVGDGARVGQPGGDALVLVERGNRRLVGDDDRDHVAALFGLTDAKDLDARRSLVEGVEVSIDVLRVRQLIRRSGDASEELQRRRYRVGGRDVVDELRDHPRVLGVFLDLGAIRLVDLLRSGRGAA